MRKFLFLIVSALLIAGCCSEEETKLQKGFPESVGMDSKRFELADSVINKAIADSEKQIKDIMKISFFMRKESHVSQKYAILKKHHALNVEFLQSLQNGLFIYYLHSVADGEFLFPAVP